jgi:SEC-C motif-containing protein
MPSFTAFREAAREIMATTTNEKATGSSAAAAAAACPCGTGRPYEACCGPAIAGTRPAETAEELMRSRYTAFARAAVDYIIATHHGKTRGEVSADSVRDWATTSEWLGFEVLGTDRGGLADDRGAVKFRARYRQKGKIFEHLEVAHFEREDGAWRFVTSDTPPAERGAPKVGRNDPCPCGSGKKHKKCCGA